MFEDLKFRKTRKIAEKALGISIIPKRIRRLLEDIVAEWRPQDYREKFLMQEATEQLIEIAALLTWEDQSVLRVFHILKDYILALGLPKRDAGSVGSEKEIRIDSSPQFRAFKKARGAIEAFTGVLEERGDPMLPTAQMIDVSKSYIQKITNFFDETARLQRSQKGWAQHLKLLSVEMSCETAETILLAIFDDLADVDVEYDDLDILTRKKINRNEKARTFLSVQRKAVAYAFGKYRKEVGLPPRRPGRPKKD